jgi:hypothetical protein
MKLEFSWQIFAKSSVFNFIKIRPLGAEFFNVDRQPNRWTDGQTDRQTDGHGEVNDLLAILRTRLKANFRPWRLGCYSTEGELLTPVPSRPAPMVTGFVHVNVRSHLIIQSSPSHSPFSAYWATNMWLTQRRLYRPEDTCDYRVSHRLT